MFAHVGVEVETEHGESLLDAGIRSRVDIPTICNGVASCHECVIRVLCGEENLSPVTSAERTHLGNVFHVTRERLACQARVMGGEVVVELARRPARVRTKNR
ncbi:MAG: (2Fe-2S)-binding protein [Deltaproteobacteria bacterium]|nr:(2Fe-2S)-binding protein [Deltaproteobacteria bacterium]